MPGDIDFSGILTGNMPGVTGDSMSGGKPVSDLVARAAIGDEVAKKELEQSKQKVSNEGFTYPEGTIGHKYQQMYGDPFADARKSRKQNKSKSRRQKKTQRKGRKQKQSRSKRQLKK